MLLVKKSVLIIFFATVLLAFLAIAIQAFVLLDQSAGVPPEDLRYRAETLLFSVIVIWSLLTALFIFIVSRSRNIDRMLDKLIIQNSMNPSSTKESLLRLGKTGGKLNLLYRQIEEISDKRGLKISSMSNALLFFSRRLSAPVLLTDISGEIVYVSQGWLERYQKTESELEGCRIETIFAGISLCDIISRLERTHIPVETVFDGIKFKWLKIENRDRAPGYLAVMPV